MPLAAHLRRTSSPVSGAGSGVLVGAQNRELGGTSSLPFRGMDPRERKAEVTRELQTLDAEHRGRPLPPEVAAHWQDLEREADDLEGQISDQEAVR